jgi:hypothetical protein
MEAANFLTEFDVPRYNVTQVTLAANEIYTLNQTFDMIAILELSGSAVLSFNDQTESDCDAGIQFRAPLGGRFSRVAFRETAGAACNIRVLTAFGNVSDSRSNISGNLSVQNAASPNDELQVQTKAGTTLATALAAADPAIAALITALREDTLLRRPLLTLTGASYAVRAAVGTTNVVTGGANANGIIVRRAWVHASSTSGQRSVVEAGGNPICGFDDAGNNNTKVDSVENVFIPAGLALDLILAGSGECHVWYEVL